MTADMGERCFYIEDFTDEVMPCYPSLEGWAKWLSAPDAEWGRDEVAADGDTFTADVIEYVEDVIATRTADGWSLSHEPEGASLVAIRFGPGMGWSSDNMVGDVASLIEHLTENDIDMDDVEHVAIGMDRPSVRLIYRADPPRLIVEGAVQ